MNRACINGIADDVDGTFTGRYEEVKSSANYCNEDTILALVSKSGCCGTAGGCVMWQR